jgi:4'-phosphopantetheinyl transferase
LAEALGDVDLHLERLDVSAPSLERAWHLLSADERERAERFRFDLHRHRFIAGRALVRETLARHLGHPAHALAFTYGPAGKPSLPGVSFNAANSEDLVLIAITAHGELGVDLERVRDLPDRDPLAAHYFHPDERAIWDTLASPDRTTAFFRWWTAKEAFLKATGTGLGGPLRETAIDFHPERPLRFFSPSPWQLTVLNAPEGYQAVLCVGTLPPTHGGL